MSSDPSHIRLLWCGSACYALCIHRSMDVSADEPGPSSSTAAAAGAGAAPAPSQPRSDEVSRLQAENEALREALQAMRVALNSGLLDGEN